MHSSRLVWLVSATVTVVWFAIYIITLSPTVNYIDSGELITALHEPGIAHPPGYPLYTLMGYVVSHILWGEVAWRVNLISALSGAAAVGCLCLLLVEIAAFSSQLNRPQPTSPPTRRNQGNRASNQENSKLKTQNSKLKTQNSVLAAAAGASLFGASATLWNRSIQAKMYTLHYLFVMLLFLLAVKYRSAHQRGDDPLARRLLAGTAAVLGLSFTNHLITILLLPGLALLLLWGQDWLGRLQFIARQWALVVPAFLIPLLLYLYLPLRASQGPVMNWGSPDSWPDLWRHVSGWQYSTYLGESLNITIPRFRDFLLMQWGWLSWLVVVLSLGAAALLAWANLPVFLATAATGLVTIGFALNYGSSEMVPYLVPLFAMMALWLGAAPPIMERIRANSQGPPRPDSSPGDSRYGLLAASLVAVPALLAAVIQFPLQNHSNDHLAELLVLNTFRHLEKDAIVLTDHWDFYSAGYYMQLVKGERPDLVLINTLSLRYPWHLEQLDRRYPWLIANSRDLADPFRREQDNWVNGRDYDEVRINQLYIDLTDSFVDRNMDKHPAYAFFTRSESAPLATRFARQPSGLASRLWKQPPPTATLQPEPQFDLRGYTYDPTPLDGFAIINANLYLNAYKLAAQAYERAGNSAKGQEMFNKAMELQTALESR